MRVSVIGGGGVGSYIGGLLARHGDDVRLLTRGAHLDAIRRDGLSVRTPTESFRVSLDAADDADAIVGSEYALLTVKGYHLGEMAPVIRLLATRGTILVPLLNGVDIAERLVGFGVRPEQILEGLITVSVVRTAPGAVECRSPFQRATIGESHGALSTRAMQLATALDRAGLATRISSEIRLDLWRKFAFLAPLAAACALRRAAIGEVLSTRDGRDLLMQTLTEVIAVGRAEGVVWAADDEAKTRAALESLPAAMKPSLLVDVEHGRPTEVDTLSGTVVRLGQKHDIATPAHVRVLRELGGDQPRPPVVERM